MFLSVVDILLVAILRSPCEEDDLQEKEVHLARIGKTEPLTLD